MYNEREKLLHHRQLLSEKEAAADLELLKKLRPNHPRLAEFGFSPKRSAGDILLELLSVAHRDEIVKNRLQARMSANPEDADQNSEDADQNSEDENQNPEDADQNPEDENQNPEDADQNPEDADQNSEDADQNSEDATSDSGTEDDPGDATEGLKAENQELQDKLEEKEDEISDLQDQLDEKDEQISDLEEQLAEEKKSETPVKTPAKRTAAKKVTAKRSGSKKK